MKSLSREKFKEEVFKRDNNKCVVCGEPAVDAHHIIDRKLWGKSCGYFIDNGVSVCVSCHWKCEKNEILPEQLRLSAKIHKIILPEKWDYNKNYDKWGKELS